MTNRSQLVVIPEKKTSLSEANNKTVVMFIKLFATKMVPNNFLGFRSNLATNRMRAESDAVASFTSVCDKENSATSAPEIKAEQNNKIPKKTILKIISPVKAVEKINILGSGSKISMVN